MLHRVPTIAVVLWSVAAGVAAAAGMAGGTAETDELVFSAAGTNRSGQPVQYLERISADGTGRRRFTIRARPHASLFAPGMKNYDPEKNAGTDLTELANVNWGNARELRQPKVSVRGKKLLFRSAWTVHAANWDGSGLVNLFPYRREWYMGSWSPDGRRVAAVSDFTNNAEIWRIDADGANLTNLTDAPRSAELAPAWSPDGRQIAFITNRSGRFELWTMTNDGENQRRLFGSPDGDVREPAWSSANVLAFALQRPDGTSSLATVRADGSEFRELTAGPWWDGQPAWDAAGKRLAFISNRSDVPNLHIREADGSIRNVTHGKTAEFSPCWVPRQIADRPPPLETANTAGEILPRPRLLFTGSQRPELRKKLNSPPCDKPFAALLERCRKNTASAMELGFAWQITGNRDFARAGGEKLAAAIRERLRTTPGNRNAGDLDMACAYDWLADALPPDLRNELRTALNHFLQTHLNHVRNYYFDSATMADCASNFATYDSAAGSLALAMHGEPGCPPGALHSYLRLVRRNLENWVDAHGGGNESYSYFVMPTRAVAPFLCSLRVNGIAPELWQKSNFSNFPQWMALGQIDGAFPNLGDSDRMFVQFSEGFRHLCADNPVLEKLWNLRPRSAAPASRVLDLIWFAPSAYNPQADFPELPTAMQFPGPGFTVFRDRFTPGATVAFFTTAAGGHAHNECGTLTLYAFGRALLTDPGQGVAGANCHSQLQIDGMGRKPNYPSPRRTPPQSPLRKTGPALEVGTDLVRAFADAVSGHTSPDYAEPLPGLSLKRGTRRLLWVPPDEARKIPAYLIVADAAETTAGGLHRFEQLWITDRDFRPERLGPNRYEFATRPAGPYASADLKKTGALIFNFRTVAPERGAFYVQMFSGPTPGFSAILDKTRRLSGRPGGRVTREYVTQWVRATREPLELPAGDHTLRVEQATNLSAVAWVPETAFAALAAGDEPAHVLPVAAARRDGERFTFQQRDLRLRMEELTPEPFTLTTEPVRYRTRFYGQIPIELARTAVRRDGTSGYFLTLLYAYRPGMPLPQCAGTQIRWPNATDTVIFDGTQLHLQRKDSPK